MAFNALNNTDCSVTILSFLSSKDLNNFAECSHYCNELRNNDGVNQDRTGTIVITQHTTSESFSRTLNAAVENDVFTGNRNCLKIVGPDKIQWNLFLNDRVRMPGVTKLILSIPPDEALAAQRSLVWSISNVIEMCPNVQDLDLSRLKVTISLDFLFSNLSQERALGQLQRLKMVGCDAPEQSLFYLTAYSLGSFRNVTELNMDRCVLYSGDSPSESMQKFGGQEGRHKRFLFGGCQSLQRLSVKEARVLFITDDTQEPLPQEYLIKFVRLHRNLRWLRSDLSPEKVAMLKRERPDVTFVSE